ncbi:hypothetical protein PAPYR_12963 [Paratrimastix pyriformis]|uniref:Uncharacterized protein n=1 Tax=Paratrimastix pyriformis TaxID=342808 RepID=A0ABQ8U111_9EUKA|nr:hypothetical protein PAPYR_12963 [Paratrimastix pyriformis]
MVMGEKVDGGSEARVSQGRGGSFKRTRRLGGVALGAAGQEVGRVMTATLRTTRLYDTGANCEGPHSGGLFSQNVAKVFPQHAEGVWAPLRSTRAAPRSKPPIDHRCLVCRGSDSITADQFQHCPFEKTTRTGQAPRAAHRRRSMMENNEAPCGEKQSPPCRPRKQLEYVIPGTGSGDDVSWRCPACFAHFEDPVCLSCGDTVCRACAAVIRGVCPTCNEKFEEQQLCPSRIVQRLVKQMQCHCPNRGLGCAAILGVLDVEHHLGSECEWREEECDQCHQQVRRAEMARHKDTTCARKPMGCGDADVGCETLCPQEDLAAHERDGVVAHVGLLRQRLAGTSADLAQTRAQLAESRAEVAHCQADLAQTQADFNQKLAESRAAQSATAAALRQTQHDLAQVKAQLTRCHEELAQTKEQTQHDLDAVRAQIDRHAHSLLGAERLFTPTRYTLRHSNLPGFVVWRMQSWRLEGSADGADGSWRTLDEHINEPNAIPARPDAMATFAVDPERAFPARHFRVLMTGPSPNGRHYMMLSGLEMYGTLSHPAHQQQ